MSKAFIYYSNTGNGDLVASVFEKNGYEVIKVTPKKELPKRFFFKVLTGGFLAGMNVKAKLVDFDVDASKYEKIVIGSPVWNGRLSSPINGALTKLDLSDKEVTFVLYAGSGEAKHAPKQIKKLGIKANIVFLKEPKKYQEELEKLNNAL